MEKTLFDITGMTCSACSARIEKAVSGMDGTGEVNVNLLANTMSVVHDPKTASIERIVKQVEDTGYGAAPKEAGKHRETIPEESSRKEIRRMKTRLYVSIIFAVPLFYISMG